MRPGPHPSPCRLRILTAREVADLLRVSAETVLRWTRHRKIEAVRLPGTKRGRARYRRSAVDAFIEAHTTGTADREVSPTRNDRAHTEAYESPVPFPVSPTRPRDRAATTEKGQTDATR